MEDMWCERLQELETFDSDKAMPRAAGVWARVCFGSIGKHMWRAAKEASATVIGNAH